MESDGWVSCVNRKPVRVLPEKKTRVKGASFEVLFFITKEALMNKIKRNAEAYNKLLGITVFPSFIK